MSVAFWDLPGTTIALISVFEVFVVVPPASPLLANATPANPTINSSAEIAIVASSFRWNRGVSAPGRSPARRRWRRNSTGASSAAAISATNSGRSIRPPEK